MDKNQNIKFAGLLPVGSVVSCASEGKRVMISGRGHSAADDENVLYDYCSVLFPEGFIDGDHLFFHNHSDITKVYRVGYINDSEMELEGKLEAYLRDKHGLDA